MCLPTIGERISCYCQMQAEDIYYCQTHICCNWTTRIIFPGHPIDFQSNDRSLHAIILMKIKIRYKNNIVKLKVSLLWWHDIGIRFMSLTMMRIWGPHSKVSLSQIGYLLTEASIVFPDNRYDSLPRCGCPSPTPSLYWTFARKSIGLAGQSGPY